jgi:Ni/Co efflux regulator RcnB
MRSVTAAVAAAALSIGIVSSAWASDVLFTASEIAAIKAYYARQAADAGHAASNTDRDHGGGDYGGSTRDYDGGARDYGGGNHGGRDYGGGNRGKGHGRKGGRGALPPGIAKNLARGKPLPPGIAMQMLPDELTVELPPPPRGYARIIVDGKVVLIDLATRVVHDILSDIVYR